MTNHKGGCQKNICKTHISTGRLQMCVLFYLLKIIMIIIKANTQIVSITKPNRSKYIISNKALSIICTTSILVTNVTVGKVATTSAYYHFLCSLLYNIIFKNTSEHKNFLFLTKYLFVICEFFKILRNNYCKNVNFT